MTHDEEIAVRDIFGETLARAMPRQVAGVCWRLAGGDPAAVRAMAHAFANAAWQQSLDTLGLLYQGDPEVM